MGSPESRPPLGVIVESLFAEPDLASRTWRMVRHRDRSWVVGVIRRWLAATEVRSDPAGAALPGVLRRIESP